MNLFKQREAQRPDLASALDRLARLGQAEPALRDAATLQSAILRTIYRSPPKAGAIELAEDRARDKLHSGVPLLRNPDAGKGGERVPIDSAAIRSLLLDLCRADLAQIMRWRRDPEHPADRYINLEHHLTAEDQQALAQSLAGYDLRAIAEALLTAADAFEPAAREVATRVGADYPAALAHTTKQFYISEFWALIAPGPAISA